MPTFRTTPNPPKREQLRTALQGFLVLGLAVFAIWWFGQHWNRERDSCDDLCRQAQNESLPEPY